MVISSAKPENRIRYDDSGTVPTVYLNQTGVGRGICPLPTTEVTLPAKAMAEAVGHPYLVTSYKVLINDYEAQVIRVGCGAINELRFVQSTERAVVATSVHVEL